MQEGKSRMLYVLSQAYVYLSQCAKPPMLQLAGTAPGAAGSFPASCSMCTGSPSRMPRLVNETSILADTMFCTATVRDCTYEKLTAAIEHKLHSNPSMPADSGTLVILPHADLRQGSYSTNCKRTYRLLVPIAELHVPSSNAQRLAWSRRILNSREVFVNKIRLHPNDEKERGEMEVRVCPKIRTLVVFELFMHSHCVEICWLVK